MARAGHLAKLGVAVSILLAIAEFPEWRVSLVVLAIAVALATWLAPGFWNLVAFAAVGGALAGILILGPGWRLVMRLVAVMDRSANPEFSVGGTLFVLLITAAIGGIMGIVVNLLGIGSRLAAGVVLGLLTTAMLFVRFSQDLTTLGEGVGVNLIMFGSVSILYGVAAVKATDRLAAGVNRPSKVSPGELAT